MSFVTFELEHPTLVVACVRAHPVHPRPSDESLLARLAAAEQRVAEDPSIFPEHVRSAVRDVLRVGGYKPTGRGKPASELLLGLAQQRSFPRINSLVDVNNLVSLEHALPISMFDAERLGAEVALRFGRTGESYVFNASGHSMDLAGLPVVCRGPEREPVGNAVRDSMACKVHAETRAIVALIYGTSVLPRALLVQACERLAELLREHAGAELVEHTLIPSRAARD